MILIITKFATILSCYCIFISAILIMRQNKQVKEILPLFFFLICVIIYLIIDFFSSGTIKIILIAGPSLLPFSFWLVSKRLFSDEPINWLRYILLAMPVLFIYYSLIYLSSYESMNSMASLIGRLISLLFVILAIYESQKGRKVDLVDKRRRFRNLFTYTISLIVLFTLMAELGLSQSDQQLPKLIQRSFILLFSTYFLIQNANWKEFFFLGKSKPSEMKDPQLIDQIQQKMVDENFYSQEGLTIRMLAENINEQEYKVRQVINQQLGYRNFTDFLNSYRISEAKKILADANQRKTTVLEVAFKVGFNSIGPFNRAFKTSTGLTPTDFRKKQLTET